MDTVLGVRVYRIPVTNEEKEENDEEKIKPAQKQNRCRNKRSKIKTLPHLCAMAIAIVSVIGVVPGIVDGAGATNRCRWYIRYTTWIINTISKIGLLRLVWIHRSLIVGIVRICWRRIIGTVWSLGVGIIWIIVALWCNIWCWIHRRRFVRVRLIGTRCACTISRHWCCIHIRLVYVVIRLC